MTTTPSASPSEIIATETGPIKAAVILAALRAHGWEVVRHPCRQPEPKDLYYTPQWDQPAPRPSISATWPAYT